MEEQKGFFESLSPKAALVVGLVGGIMALCTIGFFVLLVKMERGGNLFAANTNNNYVAPDNGTQNNNNNQQPSADQVYNVGVGHFPVRGNEKAPVTVVEFADFRCPFCERFHNDALKGMIQDYVNTGKVKFYFRSFAFLGPASTDTHMAAECANEQGKFWAMHDWLYDHQADESDTAYYSKTNLIKYAGQVGLNVGKFTTCLNSNKYSSEITKDMTDGQAVGVQGTPTIYINGKQLVGAQPYATVKAAIDAALAAAK